MDTQVLRQIVKIYEVIKKEPPLTDNERSYLIGSLETLIAMCSQPNGEVEIPVEHKSLLKKLLP